MNASPKRTTRIALATGAAGAALIGAVALGGAAYAGGPSASASASPSASASASASAGTTEAKQHAPHIGGDVLTVSGSTITVKDRQGFTRTIELASGATVTKDGAASTAAAIAVGVHIEASGTVASNGTSLDATSVRIGQPAAKDGRGGEGRHGHGQGRGGESRQSAGGTTAPTPGGSASATPSTPTPSASASTPTTGS